MKKVKFVDLFAGIGGMRLAFETAATKLNLKTQCVLSSEINANSCLVYQQNFGETPQGDIRNIKKLPPHDVLLAGFPCQPFSSAGKKAGFSDTKGTLFFEITRLIDTYKPQAFIFENVPGLLTNDKGRTIETIKHEIKKRGYSFDIFWLNSVNFELPQNRLRVYLIGLLNFAPKFNLISDIGPSNSHSCNCEQLSLFHPPRKTVFSILEENPNVKYNCSEVFVKALEKKLDGNLSKLNGLRLAVYGNYIHPWELEPTKCDLTEISLLNKLAKKFNTRWFNKSDLAFICKRQNVEKLDLLTKKRYLKKEGELYKIRGGDFSFECYKFLDLGGISVTLTAFGCSKLGIYHRDRVRRITPREAARIQGFPDGFSLHPNDKRAYEQLGNAVSINVAEAVAKEVLSNL